MRKFSYLSGGLLLALAGAGLAGCHNNNGTSSPETASGPMDFNAYVAALINGGTCNDTQPAEINDTDFTFDETASQNIDNLNPGCSS
jgi:hypothetical protein